MKLILYTTKLNKRPLEIPLEILSSYNLVSYIDIYLFYNVFNCALLHLYVILYFVSTKSLKTKSNSFNNIIISTTLC